MKKIISLLLCISTVFLSSCGIKSDSSRFSEYIDSYFLSELTSNGMSFNRLVKHPENYGIEEYPTRLGRYPTADTDKIAESYTASLAELESYNYDNLTDEQKLIYDLIKNDYETGLSGAEFVYYSEPLNAYSGMHIFLPTLLSEFNITDKKTAEQYLALLADTVNYFDSIIAFEQKKSRDGLFMSDANCEIVIDYCNTFAEEISGSELYTSFSDKIEKIDMTDEEKAAYIAENERVIAEVLVPSYRKTAEELSALKGTGKTSGAVCEYPDGKKYYEYLLRKNTGSDKTIEQIKSMLDYDIKHYRDIFYDNVAKYPELYDSENYGMKYAVTEPEEIMDYLLETMSEDYPEIPEFTANVKYISSTGAPAMYLSAPIDDAGSAVILINSSYYGGQLYSTAAHEGIPGHLYQNYYFSLREVNPVRFLICSDGYIEGWATYVERESYKYSGRNSPASIDMTVSNSIFVLALITRIDIGVNYDGWSLEDTEAFFNEYGVSAESAEYYYHLVIQKPTQYLPYYVGWREITDLKAYAQGQLGDDFAAKDFHKAILDIGPVPLKFLRPQVEAYISESQKHNSK